MDDTLTRRSFIKGGASVGLTAAVGAGLPSLIWADDAGTEKTAFAAGLVAVRGTDPFLSTLAAYKEPWFIMTALMGGGLVVGLLLRFATSSQRTHGIADVIEARAIYAAHISLRRGLNSALISAIRLWDFSWKFTTDSTSFLTDSAINVGPYPARRASS